jgi:hypothetical protein
VEKRAGPAREVSENTTRKPGCLFYNIAEANKKPLEASSKSIHAGTRKEFLFHDYPAGGGI